MKKFTLLFIVAMLIVTIIGGTISTALACKGYDTRTYYAKTYKVYAKLTRCDCTPVDNYLYTSTKAQYMSGGTYVWSNWNENYGSNVASMSSTTWKSGIVFGYCHFRHSCSTGGSAYTYYQFSVTP